MNREPLPGVREHYEALLPELRDAARVCGYALGLHGSMTYDLDLIAAPWVEFAEAPEVLVFDLRRVLEAAGLGGFVTDKRSDSPKPHGRRAWTIYGYHGVHLDVSVMPRGNA